MKIVLGSSSPYRRRLLAEMGYQFESLSPAIDEKTIRRDRPDDLVLAIAEAKSQALRSRLQEPCLLITSDQVVTCGERLMEKPADEAEARECIRRSGDQTTKTITAVVVVNTATGRRPSGVDVVEIDLSPIPDDVAAAVIAKGEIYSCAGGLDISEPLIQPYVRAMRGDIDSVIGVPKKLTRKLIDEVTE